MEGNDIGIMRELKRLIESLSRRPADYVRHPGQTEMEIARLYKYLGDMQSAGNWYVKAALVHELELAPKRGLALLRVEKILPDHLGVRRERIRLQRVVRELGAD